MFMDLTRFWKTANHAAFTRSIHPDWNHRIISMQMFCKRSNTIYHSIACGHSGLRAWRFKINSCANPYCRFGCTVVEDATHILLNCPHLENYRIRIAKICTDMNISFTVRSLITDQRLRTGVEKLLLLLLDANTDVT